MLKRIISIIFTIVIVACLFIPVVNAEDYIVVPEYDREPLYEILPSVEQQAVVEPYIVYGIDNNDITIIPRAVGIITHFFGTYRFAGEYYVYLYSTKSTETGSRLRLWISNNETMALWYEVGDFLTGSSSDYFQYKIADSLSIEDDVMIVSTRNGRLWQYYFNIYSEQPTQTATSLSFCFIGDIYLYGQTPGDIDNALIRDAFDRGKAEGIDEGFSIGYTEGKKDGSLTSYDETQIFNSGKEFGYTEGYNDGYTDGAISDNAEVYNKGIEKGQQDAQIIPSAINGFFSAMLNFFEPFLSIGFGSLNLLNLLGVIIVVGIVIIIVKITRG